MCSMSPTPDGIDKETFRQAVPMLSVEDDLFVDRVFEVLDDDGSNSIEWEEFIEAMSALEKGSREKKIQFLFQVYDEDNDGCISWKEMYDFFLHSLMVEPDASIHEVTHDFVQRIFKQIDVHNLGKLREEDVMTYLNANPDVTDVYGLFGRSMTADEETAWNYSGKAEEDDGSFNPLLLTEKVRAKRRASLSAKRKFSNATRKALGAIQFVKIARRASISEDTPPVPPTERRTTELTGSWNQLGSMIQGKRSFKMAAASESDDDD
eukprot:g3249.t1